MHFETDKTVLADLDSQVQQRANQKLLEEIQKQEEVLNHYQSYNIGPSDPGFEKFIESKRAELQNRKAQLGLSNQPGSRQQESERDRRLRLRAEERARRLQGYSNSAYEHSAVPQNYYQPNYPPELPKSPNYYQADYPEPSKSPQKLIQEKPELEEELSSIPKNRSEYADQVFQQLIGKQTSREEEAQKKKEYAEELKKQMQEKKTQKQNPRETGLGLPLGERKYDPQEQKRKYREELEAQIRERQQRKEEPKEEGFAFPSERKQQLFDKNEYAKELQQQMKINQMNKRASAGVEDHPFPTEAPPDPEKKLRYREELQKQIEEQRLRKEIEKKKRKEEDEKLERKFVSDLEQEGVKFVKKKFFDPNKPSDENPQAERYQELLRAKSSESEKRGDESNPYTPKSSESYLPRQQYFEQPSYQSSYEPPCNPPAYSAPYNPTYNPPAYNPTYSAPYNPVPPIPTEKYQEASNLMGSYMNQIQEIRGERDKAKEQMLEMREMMLKEREKQLQAMMSMLQYQMGMNFWPQNPIQNPMQYPQYPQYPPQHTPQYPAYYPETPKEPEKPKEYPSDFQYLETKKQEFEYPEYPTKKQELFGNHTELIDLNPEVPQEEDFFEQSLSSTTKWVDPNTMNWGNLNLAESVQVAKKFLETINSEEEEPQELQELQEPQEPRKRWDKLQLPEHENPASSKLDTPKFSLQSDQDIPYSEDEIPEDIEVEEEEEHLESCEKSKEIELSNPKYDESSGFVADLDPKDSIEDYPIEKRTARNIFSKPKTIDVFKARPSPRSNPTETSQKIPFSNLEDARAKVKQQKSPNMFEDIEKTLVSLMPKKETYYEEPENRRFTQIAIDELRNQKSKVKLEESLESQCFEDSLQMDSILRPISGKQTRSSRRYEDSFDVL